MTAAEKAVRRCILMIFLVIFRPALRRLFVGEGTVKAPCRSANGATVAQMSSRQPLTRVTSPIERRGWVRMEFGEGRA
jgi:hypothetical protein